MSSSSTHLQITCWLVIVFSLAFCKSFPTNQTLIFPLTTQKFRHSSSTFLQRCRLSSSPSIKIPFTHNVTLTVSFTAGFPPQNITMVLDTGSELSWLYCKKSPTLSSIFDNTKSSSYSQPPCTSPICTTQTQDLPVPAMCDKKTNLCHVTVSYVDGSSLDGILAREKFGIGLSTRKVMSFGCMDLSSSATPEEDAKTTGLMGMNRGRLSFVNQMGLSKFAYCISSSDSSGVLVLGDASFCSLPPLKYTPLITRTDRLPYFDRFAYTVQLEGIRVGSKLLPIPRSAFMLDHSGAGQTMLDSGTQFTFLLPPVYNVLKTEFIEQTKSVLAVDRSFVFQSIDLCFRVGSTNPDFSALPAVSLMFTGVELSVSGQKLLYPVPISGPDKMYCFTFGNSELINSESFIIGNIHQQNVWVEYDLARKRVGFAHDVKCDQAYQLFRSRLRKLCF